MANSPAKRSRHLRRISFFRFVVVFSADRPAHSMWVKDAVYDAIRAVIIRDSAQHFQ